MALSPSALTTIPSSSPTGAITTAQDFHNELHKLVGTPKNNFSIVKQGKRTIRKIKSREHSVNWSEVTVNLQSKRIIVNVYLELFQDEDMSDANYKRVKKLVLRGIGTYWSRTIMIGNNLYTVQVIANERMNDSVTARLMYHKMSDARDYVRSFNMGFWGLSNIVYNERPNSSSNARADASFMITSAHEFGHSVLLAFGGTGLSWGHKGSTHIIPQSVKSSTSGYPSSGEIDLMQYFDWKKHAISSTDRSKRTIISEQDIMRLIWLSTIKF